MLNEILLYLLSGIFVGLTIYLYYKVDFLTSELRILENRLTNTTKIKTGDLVYVLLDSGNEEAIKRSPCEDTTEFPSNYQLASVQRIEYDDFYDVRYYIVELLSKYAKKQFIRIDNVDTVVRWETGNRTITIGKLLGYIKDLFTLYKKTKEELNTISKKLEKKSKKS